MPWGYVGGVQCDPVEKKPFFHAQPGALAFSFGMLGCDLHCSYCQNWVTSQALRDPDAVAPPRDVTPRQLVERSRRPRRTHRRQHLQRAAHHERVGGRDLQGRAQRRTRSPAYVSNGNGTPRVLDYIRPWVDLYKVDLKSFDDRHYRQLGGRIDPILWTIRALHDRGIWLEIVTLLIPGFNDSTDELQRLTSFVAGVSPLIPWHVTAFHQDYRMNDPANTTPEMLLRAASIARSNGLQLHLRREPSRASRRSGEHALPRLPGAPCRTVRVFRAAVSDHAARHVSRLPRLDSRSVGCEIRRTDHGPAVPAWQQAPAHALTTGPAAVLDSPRPFTMSAPDISGYADVPPTPGTTTRSGGDRIPPPPAPGTLARRRLESPAESGILWRDTGAAAGDRPP